MLINVFILSALRKEMDLLRAIGGFGMTTVESEL